MALFYRRKKTVHEFSRKRVTKSERKIWKKSGERREEKFGFNKTNLCGVVILA